MKRKLLFTFGVSILLLCLLTTGCTNSETGNAGQGDQEILELGATMSSVERDDVHVLALMQAMEELLTDAQYNAVVQRASEHYEPLKQQLDALKRK